jgi:transketolase
MLARAGGGHIGGAMSIVEVLTYLYYKEMRVCPENPKKEDRDRFVLSKGHSGPSLYTVLADRGFFHRNGSGQSSKKQQCLYFCHYW